MPKAAASAGVVIGSTSDPIGPTGPRGSML